MVIIWTVLITILILGFIFLGIKISENIKDGDVKIFFVSLYFITLITVFNLGLSIFFFVKLAKKRGQVGPKGLKGKMGERGDSGICNQITCRKNTVKMILLKALKEEYPENLDIENQICKYFTENTEPNQFLELSLDHIKFLKDNIKEFIFNHFSYLESNDTEKYPKNNISLNINDQVIILTYSDNCNNL
tara:strand:- start:501 stop:1070 length:570 start_codon:yes stop_codon:yes gene_type:complete